MKKETLLFSLCIFEFLLNIVRISFYVADELVPIKIAGVGLTQLSFFLSIVLCFFVVIIVRRIPIMESLFLILLIFILIISTFFNPMRDVYFELQGWIQFTVSLMIVRLSLDNSEIKARTLLIWLTLILGFFIWFFLLVFLIYGIQTQTSMNSDIRAEGILTSSYVLGLVLISFIHLTHNQKSRLVFLVGFSSALLLVILSVTRSIIILTLIQCSVFLLYLAYRNGSWKSLIVGFLFFTVFIGISWTMVNIFVPEYLQFISYRFAGDLGYDSYRLKELIKELNLWMESPLFGYGYGLRYQFLLDGKSAFYGHNFYTSILVRVGLFGVIFFLIFGNHIKKIVFKRQYDERVRFLLKITFILVMLQLFVANFTYHLAMGFYGAIISLLAFNKSYSRKTGRKTFNLDLDGN